MSDIPVYPILTPKESGNRYFDRAYNNFKEIVKYQTLPKELASGLFDSFDIYCKTNSIESFFVTYKLKRYSSYIAFNKHKPTSITLT